MRKFFSILMLICLLWGMVLPARAEGGTARLYAQTGDGADYRTRLTFEAGETLSARFYTAAAAESPTVPWAAARIPQRWTTRWRWWMISWFPR